MPHFSLHKLRHYFASYMSSLNIPEADILEMGGWETDYVMKNVYRHTMKDKLKTSQDKASNALSKILFRICHDKFHDKKRYKYDKF